MIFVTVMGARGEEWERIAGTRTFPVCSPFPVMATLPGREGAEPVYLLDLAKVEADVLLRLVAHLRDKFSLSEDDAGKELLRSGIPILAEDTTVVMDMRLFV